MWYCAHAETELMIGDALESCGRVCAHWCSRPVSGGPDRRWTTSSSRSSLVLRVWSESRRTSAETDWPPYSPSRYDPETPREPAGQSSPSETAGRPAEREKHIYITFSHLADAFIQMRTIESIKINKRAMICKRYNKSRLA